jgi:hypothetical protein
VPVVAGRGGDHLDEDGRDQVGHIFGVAAAADGEAEHRVDVPRMERADRVGSGHVREQVNVAWLVRLNNRYSGAAPKP